MNYINRKIRSISAASATVMAFGFLALAAPGASANQIQLPFIEFDPDPAEVFHLDQEIEMEFDVKFGNLLGDTEVILEIDKKDNLILFSEVDSLTYNANGVKTFAWDGEINNIPMATGTYTARLSAPNNNAVKALTFDFEMIDNANDTEISFQDTPEETYRLGDPAQEILVSLDNFYAETVVEIWAEKEGSNNKILLNDATYLSDFVTPLYNFKGEDDNGNDLSPGQYDIYAQGTYDGNKETNKLDFPLEILEEEDSPFISFVGNTPNTYTLDDDNELELKVELENYDEDVTVELIFEGPDGNNSKTFTTDTQLFNGNETNTMTLDNDDIDKAGKYIVKIEADNVPNNDSFFITIKEPSDDNCAGFDDVDAGYKYCDAIEFVKDEGIMTGQGNGDFDAEDSMNRGEAAKISLEAFGLYNENKDYCDGLSNSLQLNDITTKAAKWYNNYVCRGLELEMITGYVGGDDDNFYRASRDVSVAEGMALILRNVDEDMPSQFAKTYNNFDEGKWYSEYAAFAYENDLFVDMGISPSDPMTRIEMAYMLYQLDDMNLL